jgi:2-polyprenyl-3-methyl-5-hydroxy-6-metoxy-1,4-benzoquinol methylase
MDKFKSYSYILELLKHNQGFDNPLEWLQYAREHDFKKVKATKRRYCPDCWNAEFNEIGQYVYYSQLMKIKECRKCFLIFSDVLLDRKIRIEHFERTYKDDDYFQKSRYPIFKQVAKILINRFSDKKHVIDVGGAKGHLGKLLTDYDSNYDITVSDLSITACEYANSHFGLKAICCSVEELFVYTHPELFAYTQPYDVMLLIDVLYLVENIDQAWLSICYAIKSDGVLIMRLPNKIWLMRLVQRVLFFSNKRRRKFRSYIYGVNPECMYFFSRKYLNKKLKELGFVEIEYLPSAIRSSIKNPILNFLLRAFYKIAIVIHTISFKQLVITPGQLIIAKRKP